MTSFPTVNGELQNLQVATTWEERLTFAVDEFGALFTSKEARSIQSCHWSRMVLYLGGRLVTGGGRKGGRREGGRRDRGHWSRMVLYLGGRLVTGGGGGEGEGGRMDRGHWSRMVLYLEELGAGWRGGRKR
jgi:hypothetical protein